MAYSTQRRKSLRPALTLLEDRCNPVLGNPSWVALGPGPSADASGFLGGTGTASGSVHSSDILPGNPDVAVVAATSGGIWRTENFTSSNPNWVSITDNSQYLFTSDVAFDPLDTSGNTLYASLGQFSSFGSSTNFSQFPNGTGSGFYKITAARSSNPNVTLVTPTVFQSQKIWEIQPTAITAPGAGQVVLASTDSGLYRSTDAGTNWVKVATVPSDNGAGATLPTTELIPDPLDTSTFYAAVPTKGVFVSKDAGETWAGVRNDQLVGVAQTKIINAAVYHKGNSVVVYGMLVENNDEGTTTILRYSQDTDTWTPLSPVVGKFDDGSKATSEVTGPYGGAIAVDPGNSNIVYVGGVRNFVGDASKPDGQQWTLLRGNSVNGTHAHDDVRSYRFDSFGNLIATNDGGIARLNNPTDPATRKWTSLSSNLASIEFYPAIAWDSYNHVFAGGTQDDGTHRLNQPGKPDATVILGGDGGITRIDNTSEPGKSTVYYSIQRWYDFSRETFDATGKSLGRVSIARNVPGTGKTLDQIATPDFIQQYSLNQVDAKRILIGISGKLYESLDRGDTFAQIDVSGFNLQSLGTSIAGGRSNGADNPDVAYVLGNDANNGVVLLRTTANGPFVKTAYAGGKFNTRTDSIAVDPDDWRRVYVITGNGAVWQSLDAGATWNDISSGLGNLNLSGSTIVVYPRSTSPGDEVIFVGGYASDPAFTASGGSGIFAYDLADANPAWAQFGKNIPRVAIADLEYNATDNILIAATIGRGAYSVPFLSDSANVVSPVLDLNGAAAGNDYAATFTQGNGAVTLLDAAGSITGTTSANISSAKIYIANFRPQDNETLAVDVTGTTITASNFKDGFLTLSGTDTKANYEKALRTLAYNNTDAAPNTTSRIVRVRVNDGTTNSNEATTTVTVVAVNKAPFVDLNGPDAGTDFAAKFTEGGKSIAIAAPTATLTDADSPNLVGAIVKITNVQDGVDESLTADVTGTAITSSYVPATGSLTLTGTDTPANYEKVLRTVQYRNLSQNPNRTTRVIQVTASDGPNTSAEAVTRLEIIAANNAPVLDVSTTFQVTAIPANAGANAGTSVLEILDSIAPPNRITDPDQGDLRGIAILSATSPNGTWEFSKDNGTTWEALTTVTVDAARLLSDKKGNLVRFVPSADFNGKASFTFRAWDGTGRLGIEGEDGEVRSTIPNGGRTPFSTAIGTATVTVGALPPPVPPVASFAITAEDQSESRTTDVVITVQLDQAAPQDLSVKLGYTGTATRNDPANPQAAFDYTLNSGPPFTVFIAAGATSGTISLKIFDDALVEPTETVIATIDPTSAGITVGANNTYTLSILDNDPAPTAKLASAPNVTTFGGTSYDFTVAYAVPVSISAASLDGSDIRIIGPNGFNTLAAFVSAAPAGNDPAITATYRMTPPGGAFAASNAGTYTITLEANQVLDTAGNPVAAGTLGTFTVTGTINKTPQTITFTAPGPFTFGVGTQNLNASSTSGLPVTFSIISGPGTVAGNVLTISGAGSIVIAADQAGDANFSAATTVQSTVTVNAADQTVNFPPPTPMQVGQTLVLPTTGTSGNPVTYTVISGPGVLTGNTLKFTGAGNVVVQAVLSASAGFNPATLTQTFTATAPTGLLGITQFAVGSDAGTQDNTVTLYNPDHTVRATFTPFPGFKGGLRTATADFNGDGIADVVVGTGPGGASHVIIIDGSTQKQLFAIDPFEASFTGGVYVAAGDINGDGTPELVITPDQGGGPRLRIFNGKDFTQIADFFGIDDTNFRGGARASIGDINGDGKGEVVVAAGFGGGPRISVIDGSKLTTNGGPTLFGDFFAFEQTLRNGTYVTVGDINGDGKADLIVGGGPSGGPRVSVFDGSQLLNNNQSRVADFFAGDPNNRGGVRIAVKNLDNDAFADLIVGAGTGAGSAVTAYTGKALSIANTTPLYTFNAIDNFTGGVFVG